MNTNQLAKVSFLIALLTAVTSPSVLAQGNGNGNGGGGDPLPKRFSVLEIPVDGTAISINEPNQGIVTVTIDGHDSGYGSAAFARINVNNKVILNSGFLPEPPFVDPNDGQFKNGPSGAVDVNDNGTIVGQASVFEDDPSYTGTDISPGRGVVWTFNGVNYEYELLPTFNLARSYASGINSVGEIVGRSDLRAVYWDPVNHEIEDLNTTFTGALGWDLLSAYDINEMGLVVGRGILEGKSRGFLLDLNDGAIWAIPLIGPADANAGYQIDATGRVLGSAWNGIGRHYGTNPNYVQGYSWDGPGSDPVILGSVTNNTSLAFGLNDLGDSVGSSIIPDDDPWANDTVPTLWEPDGDGNINAVNLRNEIANKPDWLLTHCDEINNQGWISGRGRKRHRGKYDWRAIILIPQLIF